MNKPMSLNFGFLVVLALALPVMVACIDIMAVSIAIKTIMHQFHSPLYEVQSVLSAYILGTAGFLIIFGKLADIFGRRKLMLLGIIMFGASSLLAALSYSIWLLILSRFLQGLAGAMIMMASLSIIMHSFSKEIRGPIIAKWGALLGFGTAIGPIVGGLFLNFLNWESIFLLNLPLCIVSYLLALKYLPESFNKNAPKKLPTLTSLFLTVFLISLVFVLSRSHFALINDGFMLAIGIFIISGFGFLMINRVPKNSLIEFSLFTNENFTPATICGALSYALIYGWLFLFSVFLQHHLGMSALKSGIAITPYAIAWAISSRLLVYYINRLQHKHIMQIAFLILLADLIWMASVSSHTPLYVLFIMFAIYGAAMIGVNGPSIAAASAHVASEKSGVASSIIFTIRWVGGSIGVVLTTLFLNQFGFQIACYFLGCVSMVGILSATCLKKAS